MKQSIISAIGMRGSEFGDLIEKKIDEAVATYDFDKQVSGIVHTSITQAMRNYFLYGDGFKTINTTITSILNKMFINTSNNQNQPNQESTHSV